MIHKYLVFWDIYRFIRLRYYVTPIDFRFDIYLDLYYITFNVYFLVRISFI